jgi:hypothetical protein
MGAMEMGAGHYPVMARASAKLAYDAKGCSKGILKGA